MDQLKENLTHYSDMYRNYPIHLSLPQLLGARSKTEHKGLSRGDNKHVRLYCARCRHVFGVTAWHSGEGVWGNNTQCSWKTSSMKVTLGQRTK